MGDDGSLGRGDLSPISRAKELELSRQVRRRGLGAMAYGVCKLTGNSGLFVDAHLIPKALTRPSIPGRPFISGGQGDPPKRSWSSWYDGKLVIRKGEVILAEYDSWAIRELRRLELVWSGWGHKTSLPVETWFGPKQEGIGVRPVECADPAKLRLFFLSLLWRAAATTRPEFREVDLKPAELELLRTMVRDRNPRPLDFYPISLLQIVTRGYGHNLGPFRKEFLSDVGALYNGPDDSLPPPTKMFGFSTYRFYFDGLIVHVHRDLGEQIALTEFERFLVGNASTLMVMAQTWEHSFQFTNAVQHIHETTARWPERISKLTAKSDRRKAR